ncbi:hypothetical protein AZI85_13485 [Bdellovibrio bacteriovorus]|uniref:Lipoprotein n=1 Tax=Bdellovibrio bacteriovorus TaxID=959 RepID=A0A150WC73_BDEBC|nr:hypothetical protein [Bdellovibrio bacteriovorus]KYG60470.1 hypothetical protein AZI85_13485 [Bdellovibrio bacteriovorus]
MKSIALLLLSLTFVGCGTTYQKNGFMGGYSDMKLGDGLYEVTFKGNGYTSAQTVKDGLLRRCAELTYEEDYHYFVFVDQEANANTVNMGTTHTGQFTNNYYGGVNYQGRSQTNSVTKHSRTAVIKMFKKGTQPPVAYEVETVLVNFGIIVPKEEAPRNPASAKTYMK